MNNFNEISIKYQTDKGSESPTGAHHYSEFYDRWFSPIKDKVTDICEIGVWDGCSLKAFEEYFPNAQILGLDLDDKSYLNSDRIKTLQLDQGNALQLNEVFKFINLQNRQFDLILDDGSHNITHQQLTFGKLFSLVKPGGMYIIEDLGTSYFTLGQELYGYYTTQEEINNNTIQFLNQRPFSSPWISKEDLQYINQHIDYVITFSKTNNLPYSYKFSCVNNYPIQSITSIIIKK
jgi:hypothetical protein